MSSPGFQSHDHSHCVQSSLAEADAYCAKHALQFTATRRRVLEILLEKHRALGAYAILEILRAEGLAAQPPVAYRALDFLVKHGFVHKIERLSAFVACSHPGSDHLPAFLICDTCDTVAEASAHVPTEALRNLGEEMGFSVKRTVLEATGTCPKCEVS